MNGNHLPQPSAPLPPTNPAYVEQPRTTIVNNQNTTVIRPQPRPSSLPAWEQSFLPTWVLAAVSEPQPLSTTINLTTINTATKPAPKPKPQAPAQKKPSTPRRTLENDYDK